MSTYPNDTECIRLLVGAGCSRRVIIHCCTVRAVAEEMSTELDADHDLVVAGALLHDIGRARDNSILHAVVGVGIAQDIGLPEKLVNIIRTHIGAGLDQEDVIEFGLPPGNYMPRTLEEKIVAHADNMVSDDRVVPYTFSAERLRKKNGFRGAERMDRLHQELSEKFGRDLDVLVLVLGEYPKLKGPCEKIRDHLPL